MKTLKELKENCILISEFKTPTFVCRENDKGYDYSTTIKCALYSNNKGKYYLYKYIYKGEIQEYENYEKAVERYTTLINIILKR